MLLEVGGVELGEIESRQVEAVEIAVAEAEHIGAGGLDLAQRLGRLRGRLQADLVADQAGGQADRETVAILADIEHVPAGRQLCGERKAVGEKIAQAGRTVLAPGENFVERGRCEQRNELH